MIKCTKCGRIFRTTSEIPLLVEIQNAADDICIVPCVQAALSGMLEGGEQPFNGCPNCLTDTYLVDVPSKYRRKYRHGGHILSLDELARQEFVYWHDKITHRSWFMNWNFKMAVQAIGEKGCIYYAIRNEEGDKT